MSNPQQTTREVIEQLVEALDHCMDAITERGLNGSPDQAEKWGLQLPLVRAKSAITAAQSMLANPTPSTTWEAPKRVWSASNRTATLLFWTEADARQAAAYSVAAGLEVGSITVFGNPPKVEPAPRPSLEINYPKAREHKHEYHYFGTTQSHRRCRHCNEPEPAPSTAGERAKVVEDLLMYAGDNGYSHIDYADTMRHAAALLSAPALPVPSDSDDLIKALADVRDLFPIPERGSKLEHAWMEAVAFPESVPAYVRACIAPAAMPVGELPEPFHPRASHINPDYRDGWNAALAAARSQPTTEESSVVAGAQPVREPLTDYSDTATIAGLESSVGHLSVMVDELRLMLGDAMNAMTELHSKVTPDEDTPNIDGIVPAAAYAKFVNAHADLLYRIHHSPHAGQLSRLPAAHGITKKGGES